MTTKKSVSKLGSSLLLISLLGSAACTTVRQSDDPTRQISSDPFVGINKKIYTFNDAADKAILKPIAKGYHAVLPNPVENSVGRFFKNLGEPLNIVNNLLQGKVDGALNSGYRFVVNSTVGVLGFFDVAKHYEVERKPEDFGQTLAAWGVKPGPYIVIPFLGPTNLRDGFGRLSDSAAFYPINEVTDSSQGRLGLFALDIVDTRASLLGLDDTLNNQLNPYLFLKQAYDQNRLNAIYDGEPPVQSDDDLEF